MVGENTSKRLSFWFGFFFFSWFGVLLSLETKNVLSVLPFWCWFMAPSAELEGNL